MDSLLTIPPRKEIIKNFKDSGGKIAAVFPIHYPRSLFRAFRILPVEVWGPPLQEIDQASLHLQSYVCSLVRCGLSFLLEQEPGTIDLIVVPHTCDSLQGLGSLLLDFIELPQTVITFYIPRTQDQVAHSFLSNEFKMLYDRLVKITGLTPSDNDLMEAIKIEEKADLMLAELARQRQELALSDQEYYQWIRTREYLPAEQFTEISHLLLKSPNSEELINKKPRVTTSIPVVISGIVPEPMEIFKFLSSIGLVVVEDDLACCGRRLYPEGTETNPLLRMAERIVQGPPDETRGSSIQERLRILIKKVKNSGSKGVIFYTLKFCEPELFDIPHLRNGLLQAGIPSTEVEFDLSEPLPGQLLTRLEAFKEMVT